MEEEEDVDATGRFILHPGVFVRQTRKLNDEGGGNTRWKDSRESDIIETLRRETKCHMEEWLRSAGSAVSCNDDIASRVIARKLKTASYDRERKRLPWLVTNGAIREISGLISQQTLERTFFFLSFFLSFSWIIFFDSLDTLISYYIHMT